MPLGTAPIYPVSTVCDLGFHIDANVTLTTHLAATVGACFSILRHIRSVQLSLSRDAVIIDYCCSALIAGMSGVLINRLQYVLNAAARLVFAVRKSDHVTSHPRDLHSQKVSETIQFWRCVLVYSSSRGWYQREAHVLVYCCLHDTALAYLADSLREADWYLRGPSSSTFC